MFQIGDLVYYKNLTELGVVIGYVSYTHNRYLKYRVHFLESNFTFSYEEEELTRVEHAI